MIAGALFAVTALLYITAILWKIVSPTPSVFASPYMRQNQFFHIEEKMKAKGMVMESHQLSSDKTLLTIYLEKGPVVLLSSDYDTDWQISSLHSIIYKLTIENKLPKQVDFRFGKPIVKF